MLVLNILKQNLSLDFAFNFLVSQNIGNFATIYD